MEINKKCLNSGEHILGGRSDKKFFNDLNRSRYHNKKRKEKLRTFKKTDNQLHINHEILEKFYELTKGERKGIPLELLLKEGFDHKIHFGIPVKIDAKLRARSTYYSYEYAYSYNWEEKEITIFKSRLKWFQKEYS